MNYPFYNPREAGGPTLEAMLVGRGPLLEEILEDLRRQATSASRQHWLLRGPRGIGKTHLIGVVYHRIRQEQELEDAYLPVWLAEMEAYTVYSTAVLLLEVARRLVEELRLAGDNDGAGVLAEALGGLEAAGDDPALFEDVISLLQGEARRRGKVLLVLMENLDAMLAGFRSRPEARRFRALLSEEKDLLFLSTTPTRYLRQLSDPKEPLYGHLKERTLEPLTEKEVGELFGRFAEVTGQRHLERAVGAKGESRLRRRVLHRLTGGNPRALVMAFSVLSGASGLRSMVEEIAALLDAQTAYFEARLARLAPRERAIVAAMALAPTNLTRQEIARATRLPERSLSTQIKRLVAEGHLGQTVGEGGKGTIYEVSDGLFRVWFQYRKGRKTLEPLVRFLALWYAPEELERIHSELEHAGTERCSPLEASRFETAGLQVEEALRFARSEEGLAERERLWLEDSSMENLASRFIAAKKAQQHAELVEVCEEMLNRFEGEKPAVAAILYEKGHSLGALEHNDEAITVYDELIAHFGGCQTPALAALVATALGSKSLNLGYLGRCDDAIAVCDEVVTRYGDRREPTVAKQVARALFIKSVILGSVKKPREAVGAFRGFITYGEAVDDPEFQKIVSLNRHVLAAMEAAQPRRGARSKKGPAARLREALGRIPPELRDAVHGIAQLILFGRLGRPARFRPDQAAAAVQARQT